MQVAEDASPLQCHHFTDTWRLVLGTHALSCSLQICPAFWCCWNLQHGCLQHDQIIDMTFSDAG